MDLEDMYRVVTVVDKQGSAIDRLAQGVKPFHDNLENIIVDVHPKRPDNQQLDRFMNAARMADVIDYQYFRTAEMLRERYEWLKTIPSTLTHHNPYSIKESDWASYDYVIANNKTIHSELKQLSATLTELIPNCVDPYFWKFNDDYHFERSVIMVANRIESKKGILPVAKACRQIEAKLYLVGNISDMDYFKQVMSVEGVEFHQNITDEGLRDLYYKAGVHVCNSVDNFESGTMPMLEAIFCGVPVLTRNIGQVPDIYDENNLVVNRAEPEAVEEIARHLQSMFGDKKKLEDMRHEAWISIKDRNLERRAYNYQRIWRKLRPEPVSVIMPVSDKPDITSKSINAILNQSHQNIELVVADDGDEPQKELVDSISKLANIPIRYIRIEEPGYNLAKARNLAAIEATSDVLVFCDQRIIMDENAITEFLKEIKPMVWLYGSKGVKKDWIENFSCVLRDDFASLGMFAEYIQQYGGMSQDMRSRARRCGFELKYIEKAKAQQEGKSSNKRKRKYEIMKSKNILWKLGLK